MDGFVGMVVLGCGKQVLGVRAAKTTIGRVREFGVLIFLSDFTYWSLCMARPGSGRFGVGFWVGFWVGLRARDFPTERVLSRTPLIIRTVDQNSTRAYDSGRCVIKLFNCSVHCT